MENKTTALILSCIGFIGIAGIHRLFLFTIGFFGIGTLVDLINISMGKFKDKKGRVLK